MMSVHMEKSLHMLYLIEAIAISLDHVAIKINCILFYSILCAGRFSTNVLLCMTFVRCGQASMHVVNISAEDLKFPGLHLALL